MTESAPKNEIFDPAANEGLGDLFNAELADDLDVVRPAIVEGQGLPLTEAAQILNITRRSALRLIHEGKLAATKDGHGQWLVDRTSIKERLSAKSSASGNVEQVAVHVDDVQGHAWSEGQAAGQQHLLKELIDKIETPLSAAQRFSTAIEQCELHSLKNLKAIEPDKFNSTQLDAFRDEWTEFLKSPVNTINRQMVLNEADRLAVKYHSLFLD